jgi:hypothetical protein
MTNSRRQILHPKIQIQSDRTLNLNWTLEQGMIHGQGCKDCPSVTDLQGPPLTQVNRVKIDALKRRAQEIARDLRSRDDVQISYLETLEEHDNDNLRLAQMLAG